jgi:TatD DNase family protein
MFIDTHCHINMMVKKSFDVPLSNHEYEQAHTVVQQALTAGVATIINVGTSLVESENCVGLAKLPGCYASIGIHPNDCTPSWRAELTTMQQRWFSSQEHLRELRIVAIGECGLDFHYENFDKQRQYDAFRAQIELALTYDLALIVHSRDAADETLMILDEYRKESLRGVMHCFSQDQLFADKVIQQNFVIGLGGTITYPKNEIVRLVAKNIALNKIILETDAPFLPPQEFRGQQNHPRFIPQIAKYLAELRQEPLEQVASTIFMTTKQLFKI